MGVGYLRRLVVSAELKQRNSTPHAYVGEVHP